MEDKDTIKTLPVETIDTSTKDQIETLPIEAITTYTDHSKQNKSND